MPDLREILIDGDREASVRLREVSLQAAPRWKEDEVFAALTACRNIPLHPSQMLPFHRRALA
ncbi:hypothetical protein NSPZN2_40146 [Nitrospira defluvii]|uniref:Uncharacterized protein n=1 Tax=Nitrospira defluvii TaxID=330214 RepID=A0ABN7LT42_9BACT|nr:hypothetical protein NSPZN2_40146 [Nitrospira defluvii]